jgi:hypothetical protein
VDVVEAKKLLAPGFSLSSLAATCGIPEEKQIFCFDKLTSRAFLDEPRLPSSASEWTSALGKAPSQSEVDAALADFDRLGCSRVKDFLVSYLKNDVVVLLHSMVKLNRSFHSTLGLHPVDSNRLTVSSLATNACQAFLSARKRPAQHFVNDAFKYSVSFFLLLCLLRAVEPDPPFSRRRFSRPVKGAACA